MQQARLLRFSQSTLVCTFALAFLAFCALTLLVRSLSPEVSPLTRIQLKSSVDCFAIVASVLGGSMVLRVSLDYTWHLFLGSLLVTGVASSSPKISPNAFFIAATLQLIFGAVSCATYYFCSVHNNRRTVKREAWISFIAVSTLFAAFAWFSGRTNFFWTHYLAGTCTYFLMYLTIGVAVAQARNGDWQHLCLAMFISFISAVIAFWFCENGYLAVSSMASIIILSVVFAVILLGRVLGRQARE